MKYMKLVNSCINHTPCLNTGNTSSHATHKDRNSDFMILESIFSMKIIVKK